MNPVRGLIPNNWVNRGWHFPKAVAANLLYGFPSRKLRVIGVTGTKGKTTTAHLIYHLLVASGRRVALISTLVARFGEEELATGLHVTNPGPLTLQRLLKKAVEEGYQFLVLEVTSHGLAQYRNWGVEFELGVFTQITSDHLAYHGGPEEYRRAKAQLVLASKKVLINHHDQAKKYLSGVAKKAGVAVVEYRGRRDDFQSQNEAAALAAAGQLGVDRQAAGQALRTFPGVSGRMETVFVNDFEVVIDFAHTPDSLEAALKQLRKKVGSKGRLIAVFGAAGERDPGRRKMGAVAAKLADFFIITAEDPRTEGVQKISEEIAGWAREEGGKEIDKNRQIDKLTNRQIDKWMRDQRDKERGNFMIIPDRQEAIDAAVKLAKKGDVIGLFGKGHERSMCFGTEETPWLEHKAVRLAFKAREWKI